MKKTYSINRYLSWFCVMLLPLSVSAQGIIEIEPNDSPEQAQNAHVPGVITGVFAESGDEDYYRIDAGSGGVENVTIDLAVTGQGDAYMRLLDAAGTELTSADFFEGAATEQLTSLLLPTGLYFLVTGFSFGEADAAYSLTFSTPVEPSTEAVNAALQKSLGYLLTNQLPAGSFEGNEGDGAAIPGLVVQALLGADCLKRNDWDAVYRSLDFLKTLYHDPAELEAGRERDLEGGAIYASHMMYEHAMALTAMIEAHALGVKEGLDVIIRQGIDLILRAQLTSERPSSVEAPVDQNSEYYGGWRYGVTYETADISVTDWQIIALLAARNAGFEVPAARLDAARQFVKRCFSQELQAFTYMPGEYSTGAGRSAMGVFALQLLGEGTAQEAQKALRDILYKAPSWHGEVGDGYPFYYWYYGTRAAYLAGGETWNAWRKAMCGMLVNRQNADGSWTPNQLEHERTSEVFVTAMGSLILEFCCGSVPIYMRTDKAPQRETAPPRVLPAGITVDLVATVTDTDNNYVMDLEKEQFSINEDGAEQKIVTFSREVTPVSMVLVIDASGSMKKKVAEVHQAATEFIAMIQPGDRVAVVQFADGVELVQSFTADATALRDAIDKCGAKGGTALYDAVIHAVSTLHDQPGRTAIILLTDGRDENDPGTAPGSVHSFDESLEHAKTAGVTIYALGLGQNLERSVLENLARETGGRVYFPPTVDDLAEVYGFVAKELRSQYTMSYVSSNNERNGEWREVEVTVPDSDYQVRTKSGYYAPRE
ncbi:VWA domain-containing protein [bacterium]|nr:VWA domain-containing protein [candidate division CSSED10-310 bacterium]